jgi:hypothetical protein
MDKIDIEGEIGMGEIVRKKWLLGFPSDLRGVGWEL